MFGLQPKISREHAEKLVRQGKTTAAIEVYERLLEADHGNANLIMPLGDLYARAGRNTDAERLFRGLAEQLDAEGYHGRAAALWRKILKLDSESPESETRLARSLLAQGSRIEAATALHAVIDRAEKHKQWKAAAEAYALLTQAETPRAETSLRWGRALAQAGDKPQAQARLLAGLELATAPEAPQLGVAGSLLQELEVLDPQWPPYRAARAELAELAGDAAGVRKWLPEPGTLPAAQAARAWRMAAQAGDPALAMQWARAALEAGAAETACDYGRHLLESGDEKGLTAWVGEPIRLRREELRPQWLELFAAWSAEGELPIAALQAWLCLLEGREAEAEARLRQRLAARLETAGELTAALEQYRWVSGAIPTPATQAAIERLEWKLGLRPEPAPEPEAVEAVAEPLDAPAVNQSDATAAPAEEPPLAAPAGTAARRETPLSIEPFTAPVIKLPATDLDFTETVIDLDLTQAWTEDETEIDLDGLKPAAKPFLQPQPAENPAGIQLAADPFLADLADELNQGPQAAAASPARNPSLADRPSAPAQTPTVEMLADVLAEFQRGLPGHGPAQSSDAEQHMHTGIALREMGLWEEAIAELQRAHNAWPAAANYAAQRRLCAAYLGECFQRMEMPESALPWYQRVLADPATPKDTWQGAAYETAGLLEHTGELREAARLLQQIYAENVDFLDVGERLRALRAKLHEPAEAQNPQY